MPTLPPEQLARLRALLDQMRLQSRGSSWSAAKGNITDWGSRFIPKRIWDPNPHASTFISKKRLAEINERIRAEKAATQQRPVTRSHGPVTVQERTQPGTARSSKGFQGHSRRGRGGGFIFGEDILGSKGDWHRRRFPRKRNLSEVYRPQGMITV